MNKLYLGNTQLVDLTGYATESYVDTAVANVDVTDQLENYVLKTTLDASVATINSSIQNSDASIAAVKDILTQIVGDGETVTEAIDTFNELKQFVADYTTSNDLSTLIAQVKTQAVADASADAAGKYVRLDALNASIGEVAYGKAHIDSSITALDTSIKDTYNKAHIDASVAAIDTSVSAIETALTNNIDGDGTVEHVVKCTASAYAAIGTKDPKTLYIVMED